jgi:NAD(P) transhydrogenase subunit alpha
MLKDNIVTIDWTDEVLAKTALTHDGKLTTAEVPKPAPVKTPAAA